MVWKQIAGFESLYDVSDTGLIRNARRKTILAPRLNRDGYSRAALSKDGIYKHALVHRMVALAFLGEPPKDKPLVCHNDGNPKNNASDNLRWGSASDNMFDKTKHGTNYNVNKTSCINGHDFTEENTYLNKDGDRSCNTCRRKHTVVSNEKRRNGLYE